MMSQKSFKLGIVCFYCLLILSFSTSVYSAESGVLKDLDRAYYYPEQEGLQRVTAEIKIEQMDPRSPSQSYFGLPIVRVSWSAEDREARFSLIDPEVVGETAEYVLDVVKNFKDMLFPATLEKQLESYSGKVKVNRGKPTYALFKARNERSNIREYKLWIDPAKRRIQKMQIVQNQGPPQIDIEFAYTSHSGKWRVEESQAQFELDDFDFKENTHFTFSKVKDFWIVRKIIEKLRRDGILTQSYILTLDNIQVN